MEIHLLPKFLQVELTYACNSRCSFCYNPTHKKHRNEDSLFAILSELNTYRLGHIQLIGGEVTVMPQLPEYLKAIDKAKWRSIVTNGRIFREDIRGLINEIYISLHGDEATHEELTGISSSFESIVQNIKKYVSWGIDVNSDTVLTKYNFDQVYSIAEYAQSLGMKRLFLNIFQPEGIGSQRPDFSPSHQQLQEAITQIIEARNKLGFEMYFGTSTPFCLDERLITENLAFRCGAGEWFASISPQGDLRICNHSTKSYGNILEIPLNQIWHSKQIDVTYRNLKLSNGICDSCSFQSECLGGCRIDEKGNYRVDPIVIRDEEKLLSKETLSRLYNTYVASPHEVSYR